MVQEADRADSPWLPHSEVQQLSLRFLCTCSTSFVWLVVVWVFFSFVLQEFYQKGLVGKRGPPDLKAELNREARTPVLRPVTNSEPATAQLFSTRHFHTHTWHEHPFPPPQPTRTRTHTSPLRSRRALCEALAAQRGERPWGKGGSRGLPGSGPGPRPRHAGSGASRQALPVPGPRSEQPLGVHRHGCSPHHSHLLPPPPPPPTAPQFKSPRHVPRMRTACHTAPRLLLLRMRRVLRLGTAALPPHPAVLSMRSRAAGRWRGGGVRRSERVRAGVETEQGPVSAVALSIPSLTGRRRCRGGSGGAAVVSPQPGRPQPGTSPLTDPPAPAPCAATAAAGERREWNCGLGDKEKKEEGRGEKNIGRVN